MLLNKTEFILMNNPLRAAVQRYFEAPQLLKNAGEMKNAGYALEVGCGCGAGFLNTPRMTVLTMISLNRLLNIQVLFCLVQVNSGIVSDGLRVKKRLNQEL